MAHDGDFFRGISVQKHRLELQTHKRKFEDGSSNILLRADSLMGRQALIPINGWKENHYVQVRDGFLQEGTSIKFMTELDGGQWKQSKQS